MFHGTPRQALKAVNELLGKSKRRSSRRGAKVIVSSEHTEECLRTRQQLPDFLGAEGLRFVVAPNAATSCPNLMPSWLFTETTH